LYKVFKFALWFLWFAVLPLVSKSKHKEAASSAQHRPSTTAQCSCDLIIPFHIWPSKAHVSKDPCLLLSKNEKQLA
jgi:hypothetical protein